MFGLGVRPLPCWCVVRTCWCAMHRCSVWHTLWLIDPLPRGVAPPPPGVDLPQAPWSWHRAASVCRLGRRAPGGWVGPSVPGRWVGPSVPGGWVGPSAPGGWVDPTPQRASLTNSAVPPVLYVCLIPQFSPLCLTHQFSPCASHTSSVHVPHTPVQCIHQAGYGYAM